MQLFKKITLFTTIMAFCLIVLGAYVRLSDAGLGCPDWPGCFGTLTVPESQMAIEKAQHTFPDQIIENDKAWKEMAHRYVAGILGLLILTIGVLAHKNKKSLKAANIVSFTGRTNADPALPVGFEDQLFATLRSGTTGEFNCVVEAIIFL